MRFTETLFRLRCRALGELVVKATADQTIGELRETLKLSAATFQDWAQESYTLDAPHEGMTTRP